MCWRQLPLAQPLPYVYPLPLASILKRTIGNLPGVRCLPKETWLFQKMGSRPVALKAKLRKWDTQAAEWNYTGW